MAARFRGLLGNVQKGCQKRKPNTHKERTFERCPDAPEWATETHYREYLHKIATSRSRPLTHRTCSAPGPQQLGKGLGFGWGNNLRVRRRVLSGDPPPLSVNTPSTFPAYQRSKPYHHQGCGAYFRIHLRQVCYPQALNPEPYGPTPQTLNSKP